MGSVNSSNRDYSLAEKNSTGGGEAPLLPYEPPMPKHYRPPIGIIGCGGVTDFHLRAYREAGWEVGGFFDIHEQRAIQKRDEFYPNAVVFNTLQDLLADRSIEVLDIATHPKERVALIESALKAKKHVLSQKPFVLDLNVGRRLIQLAERNNVYLAVNHNGRWAPHFSYLRLAAQAGVLGPVGSLIAAVSWDHTWTKGTPFERIRHLLLYDFGIHWFDMVCQIFAGQRAVDVSTCLRQAVGQPIAPPLIGTVRIGFENGIASLNFHAHSMGGKLDATILTGNDGILFSQGPNLGSQQVRLETRGGSCEVDLHGTWFMQGFQGTMGELLCAIEEKRPPSNSAESALDGLALCFAAIKSAATGARQTPGTIVRAPSGCLPE